MSKLGMTVKCVERYTLGQSFKSYMAQPQTTEILYIVLYIVIIYVGLYIEPSDSHELVIAWT